MKKLTLIILLASISSTSLAARVLPHVELVKKYLGSPGAYNAKIASCKGIYMTLDENDIDCWAVHTAKDLSKEPTDTRELVLSSPKLEAAQSKCQAMSMKEQFDSRLCAAAGQADTFIWSRLPGMKLKPLKFK